VNTAPARVPLPNDRVATAPPEARGVARDRVRLLVADPERVDHATFRYIDRFLQPGDLMVVNTSATLPAAIAATRSCEPIVVHFSTRQDDGAWTVELRKDDGTAPLFDGRSGELIELAGAARLEILGPFSGIEGRSRLVRARVDVAVEGHLARYGRPISYSHLRERWPLSMYQTVFAREPGSVEMPSAGRPFSTSLVTELVTRGVLFAPITLHTGVSSLERGETPFPERVDVPAPTAALVQHTKRSGGRVIAVGTTVTRALETATDADGVVQPFHGWTELALGPERPARTIDGLITGWHTPEASHQLLLEAVAGRALVDEAYAAALRNGYLSHEFGDSCLLLPRGRRAGRGG
jgi:S-adenosylmethionine:tRNA ribosyltransferase-isomerase